MPFKIKSNPMHPLSGALPLRCVLARVTHGALVARRHSFEHPRRRTSQYRRTFVPLSMSLLSDLSDPVFDGVGPAGFKRRANAFLLACSALSFLSPTILSSSSLHGLVVCSWGLWTDRVFSLSPGLAQWTPNNNNNNTTFKVMKPDRSGTVSWSSPTSMHQPILQQLVLLSHLVYHKVVY